MRQIRERLLLASREAKLDGTEPVAAVPPPPAPAAPQEPLPPWKQKLKNVPLLSKALLLAWRTLKMPGRLMRVENRLGVLDQFHAQLHALQESTAALARQVQALQRIATALSEKQDAALRFQQERLAPGLGSIAANVGGLHEKSDRLHEKSDRYTQLLRGDIRANAPIMHAGRDLVIGRFDDFIMAFPAEEWRLPAFQIMAGALEPGQVRAMKSVVREGMTVVDVGASVGTYTLLALRAVGATGKVYSYEPTPRSFSVLKDNVQINGFLETGRSILKQKAVSDGSREKIPFYIVKDALTHNSLYREDVPNVEPVEVDTVSLDADLGEQRVDVVKIDAEGAEPAILRGMRGILRDNPAIVVFIEFAPMHLQRAGVELHAYLDEIRDYGFEIRIIDEQTGELRPASEPELAQAFSVNLMLRRPA